MTVIPSYVMPYYTSGLVLSIFIAVVSIIGVTAYMTWAVFGTIFKRFLHKYQKAANAIMALFLGYSAILVSGFIEYIKG